MSAVKNEEKFIASFRKHLQLAISTAACVVPGRVWSAAADAVPTVPEVACSVKMT
jgi:hypothetical protein